MSKVNTKELTRSVQILEVDVDSLNQEREIMLQEIRLMEERIRKLEDRLAFMAATLGPEVTV